MHWRWIEFKDCQRFLGRLLLKVEALIRFFIAFFSTRHILLIFIFIFDFLLQDPQRTLLYACRQQLRLILVLLNSIQNRSLTLLNLYLAICSRQFLFTNQAMWFFYTGHQSIASNGLLARRVSTKAFITRCIYHPRPSWLVCNLG